MASEWACGGGVWVGDASFVALVAVAERWPGAVPAFFNTCFLSSLMVMLPSAAFFRILRTFFASSLRSSFDALPMVTGLDGQPHLPTRSLSATAILALAL